MTHPSKIEAISHIACGLGQSGLSQVSCISQTFFRGRGTGFGRSCFEAVRRRTDQDRRLGRLLLSFLPQSKQAECAKAGGKEWERRGQRSCRYETGPAHQANSGTGIFQ